MTSILYVCFHVCVDPQIIPAEDHFTDSKIIVVNYKKNSTPGPIPTHWLGFSYIRSENYKLDQNFDDTELKKQSENV